jgi:hypothetical protein
MFQTLAKFEAIIENKAYHFLCDPNSSIDHVKEALFQVQKSVAVLEDQIKAAQESAKKCEEVNTPVEALTQENPEVEDEQ